MPSRRWLALVVTTVALSLALSVDIPGPSAARADTAPPAGTPRTVSADALPTVQINGVVWAQVMVGNTVYATGEFTRARPPGAKPGHREKVRRSLLAFDVRTGRLLPFHLPLNAAGRALAVSPNKKRLYVGGSFTRVGGKPRDRIAAINLRTGKLVPRFRQGVDSGVRALAATNKTVYVGGFFSRAGGKPRQRLAAFARNGRLRPWSPEADGLVRALVMSPDRRKVVIGGSFGRLDGRRYHALGAVAAGSGQPLPWASQSDSFPIRNDANNAGIISLSADANHVYLTGFNVGNRARPGAFEGRAAISPDDGRLVWVNDCHGDSYSSVPIGKVLYSVGHAHDCEPIGAFPEEQPWRYHRALAETVYPTGTNGPATNGYTSFEGLPSSTQLVWYPTVNTGSVTGQVQGGWSIVGNKRFLAMGGEFTEVNGQPQQGLTRFAIRKKAPNKRGPQPYADSALSAGSADAQGRITVRWPATWDQDNALLTYRLYRAGVEAPIHVATAESRFWDRPEMSYVDTGRTPGTTQRYRLVVLDPLGNSTRTATS
jgi:hypothetical protein